MARLSSERGGESELAIIKEEQVSPVMSSNILNPRPTDETTVKNPGDNSQTDLICRCGPCKCSEVKLVPVTEMEKNLKDQEDKFLAEFDVKLDKELDLMKDKFNFILQNEELRTACMLREAHRERQEKISTLQTQLECKNLAGLMYVLCTERQKSRMEKLRVVEEYTRYIRALQEILTEGQELILNLSRGYKTAARVDWEWRQKMGKVLNEFQNFIHHFAGGTPDENQYFFDIPSLMTAKADINDNPKEHPCEMASIEEEKCDSYRKKEWFERLEDEDSPFLVLGDMEEFLPPERREVLKAVKARKTAPYKWSEYVFNEMYIKSDCPNGPAIKDEFKRRYPPTSGRLEGCGSYEQDNVPIADSRRVTTPSVDIRNNMGSILKMITATGTSSKEPAKSTLLAARDSMEIASSTKLLNRVHGESTQRSSTPKSIKLNLGNRAASIIDELADEFTEEDSSLQTGFGCGKTDNKSAASDNEDIAVVQSGLGSLHKDSLSVIPTHVPDQDARINFEKVCPMEQCQRLHVDSFTRSLPKYMRASPFTHFEQTYDEYEPCSPEQMEILKERLQAKRKKEKSHIYVREDEPMDDWVAGNCVAVQTSMDDLSLPPCTCRDPNPTPVGSVNRIYTAAELMIPLKQTIDHINHTCLHDERIEFDRFKVVGQDSMMNFKTRVRAPQTEFTRSRVEDIRKILKQYPSLCDLFQGNTKC